MSAIIYLLVLYIICIFKSSKTSVWCIIMYLYIAIIYTFNYFNFSVVSHIINHFNFSIVTSMWHYILWNSHKQLRKVVIYPHHDDILFLILIHIFEGKIYKLQCTVDFENKNYGTYTVSSFLCTQIGVWNT